MGMKRTILASSMGLALVLGGLGYVVAQESKPAAGAHDGHGHAEGEQPMDAMPMPKPSPEHAMLKQAVGTWDIAVKMYMQPGAPPTEGKAVETARMIGEFWVITDYQGSMFGMPFSGSATMGFDPSSRKYVSTWIDSASPYVHHASGTYDEATKTLTSHGQGMDASGQVMKSKMVQKTIDDDHCQFQMYAIMPDGSEFLWMDSMYTRRR